MPWLFVTLGLIAFVSSLYGLIVALQARRMFIFEAAELALLAVAWSMHHTTTAGWVALWAAIGLEALRGLRALRPRPSTVSAEPVVAPTIPSVESPPGPPPMAALPEMEPVASPPPTPVPVKPMPAPVPPKPRKPEAPPLASMALLRSPWQPAPEVFLASLRRGGERGAKLAGGPQGRAIKVTVDGLTLELECVSRPLPKSQIDDAAAQSWDWPEAAKTAGAHVGHVVFTTRAANGASRAAGIRLHGRAQQALAEFAPVIGVLWPAAGRLIPVDSVAEIAGIADDFELAKATCINFRTFPLENADAARYLCDTVGYSAFGVTDLEVECEGEPDAALTSAIYKRAQEMFEAENDVNTEGVTFEHGGRSWRIERARSRFAPDRVVGQWVRSQK